MGLRPVPAQGIGVSVRGVRPLALLLQSSGVDAAAWLSAEGISPQTLFDDDARIPFGTFRALWDQAEGILPKDDAIGVRALELASLRFGAVSGAGSAYLLLDLFAASETLGAALQRLCTYWPVPFSDEMSVVPLRTAGSYHLEILPVSLPAGLVDYAASMIAFLTRTHTSLPAQQSFGITLRRRAPRDSSAHERVLGPRIRFGAAHNRLSIHARQLDVPLGSPRPALAAVLERRADDLLSKLRGVPSVVAQVEALLMQELPSGNPAAEHIAARLGISVRTMSRKLLAAGVSHKELLDGVRARLAERYLLEDNRTATEVALLLGFAELSAFDRAFKRWHGTSPTLFRRAKRAGRNGQVA